eukprot:Clim_evm15s199 gene=Clim_evmTU15s199
MEDFLFGDAARFEEEDDLGRRVREWNLLPYAEDLPAEADHMLAQIKEGLYTSSISGKLNTHTLHWTRSLGLYLELYEEQFDLDVHLRLIKAVYALVTIKDLPHHLQTSWARILHKLLRKKHLVSVEDLVLPWRPLYEIIAQNYFPRLRAANPSRSNHSNTLTRLIGRARRYFATEATQEILDEFKCLMCPFDESMFRAQGLLCLFLPTNHSEKKSVPWHLWYLDLYQSWDWIEQCPDWDLQWFHLYARLAEDNVGQVDWSPFLSTLFMRILRTLNVPVGTNVPAPSRMSLPPSCTPLLPGSDRTYLKISSIGDLIVNMMTPDGVVQKHLNELLRSVESFFHPSNSGSWTRSLSHLLMNLTGSFARRLMKEKKGNCPIPESARLGKNECVEFVKSMRLVIMHAMFAKSPTMVMAAGEGLKHLAFIAPEEIIPQLMEVIYPALETVTEVHQTVSVLSILSLIAKPLVTHSHYPEGCLHLAPLMQSALHGIDPNDYIKTDATLRFYSAVLTCVPICDLSSYASQVPGATEQDREIMYSTAFFEDWVVAFIDRICLLCENQLDSENSGNRSIEANQIRTVVTTAELFFAQLSPELFKLAVERLFRFMVSNLHMPALKLVGQLCGSAARMNPELTLKIFIPYFSEKLTSLIAQIEVNVEDGETVGTGTSHADADLLWSLRIVSQIVRHAGPRLLSYKKELLSILVPQILHGPAKPAKSAMKLLRNCLKSLTEVYSSDLRCVNADEWKDPAHFLSKWGQPSTLEDISIEWHVPSDEEQEFAYELLDKLLEPELVKLARHCTGEATVSNSSIQRSLLLIFNAARGSLELLETENGGQEVEWNIMELPSRVVDLLTSKPKAKSLAVERDGGKYRERIGKILHDVVLDIQANFEDDAKVAKRALKALDPFLTRRASSGSFYHMNSGFFNSLAYMLANVTDRKRMHTRNIWFRRVMMLQRLRVSRRRLSLPYTALAQQLLLDVYDLCFNRYSGVRKKAQALIQNAFGSYKPAKYDIIEKLMPVINKADKAEEHEIKGALWTVQSGPIMRLICHEWGYLTDFVQALSKLHSIHEAGVQKVASTTFWTYSYERSALPVSLRLEPEQVDALAGVLDTKPADSEVGKTGITLLAAETTHANAAKFFEAAMEALGDDNMHWRYQVIVTSFIFYQIQPEVYVPEPVVAWIMRCLRNESAPLRVIAFKALNSIIADDKKKPAMEEIVIKDVSEASKHFGPHGSTIMHKGMNNIAPLTESEYNSAQFYDKNSIGWNIYPRRLGRYEPVASRKTTDIAAFKEEELTPPRKIIIDTFNNSNFTDAVIAYLDVDQGKEKARFEDIQAQVFKGLARNYGPQIWQIFKPHFQRLSTATEEHSQRVAAEIVAGIVRGTKHWAYEDVEAFWMDLSPDLQAALNAITQDTLGDWASAIRFMVYDRDPRRLFWLSRLLVDPLPFANAGSSSFEESRRLQIILFMLDELSWRGAIFAADLLRYITPHLAHPYQQVRTKIGRAIYVAMRVFWVPDSMKEVQQVEVAREAAKELLELTTSELDKLAPLSEDETLTKTCKTILHWLNMTLSTGVSNCAYKSIVQLVPYIFRMIEQSDEELQKMARGTIILISQSTMPNKYLSGLLSSVWEVLQNGNWHVRVSGLKFLQSFIFRNLFHLNMADLKTILHILNESLLDEQVEVRKHASKTLAGIVRCDARCAEFNLYEEYFTMARTPLARRKVVATGGGAASMASAIKSSMEEQNSNKDVIRRHAGVLGLSAFISAYPYDVPEFVAPLIVELGNHSNDPMPMKGTVNETLSDFWRTHRDNWQSHKKVFSEDEITMLTDLLISPSYYA